MLFVQHAEMVFDLYVGLGVSVIALILVAGYAFMPPCIWLVNRPQSYLDGLHLRAAALGRLRDRIQPVPGRGDAWPSVRVGYVMRYFRLPFLPMVLGVVLGFLVEIQFPPRPGAVGRRRDRRSSADPISAGLPEQSPLLFIIGRPSGISADAARKSDRVGLPQPQGSPDP